MIESKEQQFLQKIDCLFPYDDEEKATIIINTAISLSSNAVFGVIHELVRVPKSTNINIDRKSLLNYIDSTFQHPLKKKILGLAKLMIANLEVDTNQIIKIMKEIEKFPNEYSALNIAYFAHWDESIEDLYEEIKIKWENLS